MDSGDRWIRAVGKVSLPPWVLLKAFINDLVPQRWYGIVVRVQSPESYTGRFGPDSTMTACGGET